jgi:uncharacterized repeat protein (TIGR01451 family)
LHDRFHDQTAHPEQTGGTASLRRLRVWLKDKQLHHRLLVLTAMFAVTARCETPPETIGVETRPTLEAPLFNNGGFENPTPFTSWTKSTALNTSGLSTVPPTLDTHLQLTAGGRDFTFAKTNLVPESQPPAGLVAGTGVPMWPRLGTTTAAINEWGAADPPGDSNHQGANSNVNSIRQSMATTAADIDPADGKVHVRFLLAPVLEAAGHAPAQQPYFFVIVRNLTAPRVGTLYTNFNFANQVGVPWGSQGSDDTALLFTPWQIFDVVPEDDTFVLGDVLEVEVYAAGCDPGGHSGSAYVDGFGASLPSLLIAKTAPSQANVDSDITYTFSVKNNTSGIAPNVVADEVLPPNTTFVSYSAPTATSCTVPSVGGTGTVSCTYGWMNPGATENFSVTVRAYPQAAGGSVTASTTTSVTDSAATYVANAYRGYTLFITSGPQAGTQAFITGNTATVLNVTPAFATAPAVTSTYKIINPPAYVGTAVAPFANGTIIKSGAPAWTSNQYLGWSVVILSGTGANQIRIVGDNDANLIDVVTNWSTTPGASSVFAITRPVQSVVNGNYGVAGPTVSRLLGPKRETLITTGRLFSDLSITKTNNASAVVWGTSTSYTITVVNNGPNTVTNATVIDTLPPQLSGATWTCLGSGSGTCASGGTGNINQNVTLPVGGQVVFTLTAGVTGGTGTSGLTNVASVTAPSGIVDPYPLNDSAADTDTLTTTLRQLSFSKDPASTGTGTVSSAPIAINCGPSCSTQNASFANGTVVTLTAIATANHRFLGWGGACSGSASTCDVTMSAALSVTALFSTCGNSVRDASEGCDDGNINNGDGCNANCLVETNSPCNGAAPGLTGNTSCASGLCDAVGNVAPGVCEAVGVCGNGTREAGEGCDDGNATANDGCTACRRDNGQACNTAVPGLTGPTSCTSGVCDTVGNAAPGVCEAAGACGNSIRDASEGCDDGNVIAGDGCNATCRVETTFACSVGPSGLTGSSSCASGVCDAVGNLAPGICEAAGGCGNGTRDASEGCDDGNVNAGDGCNATCRIENGRNCNTGTPGLTGNTGCASGRCDTLGNVAPGQCEALGTCGNGLREAGEGCDDGNLTGGDGCSGICLVENGTNCGTGTPGLTGNTSCQSGVCDAVGNAAPGRCEAPFSCGNGVREIGEGCDDGNVATGDGCNATCLIENNTNCNATAPGFTGSTSCASGICDAVGNAAPGRCEASGACGNGVREAGEGCDDGNTSSADACSATCRVQNGNPCNASVPGLTGPTSCTSGVCDTVGNAAPGVCEASGGCGNGTREAGEGCDDGNTANSDGCTSACRVENTFPCNSGTPGVTGPSSCVSGICDTLGNSAPGRCEATGACGNGVREAGEACDDGNAAALDGCNATCRIENGRPCNTGVPGLTGNTGCSSGRCDTVGNAAPGQCEALGACGNGLREAGEGCDDGNITSNDGCSAVCLRENNQPCATGAPGLTGSASCQSGVCDLVGSAAPGVCEASNTCGNGIREAGEGCDDGNVTSSDGCSATCLVENGGACNASSPGLIGGISCQSGICDTAGNPAPGVCEAPNTCGNGVRDSGEGCDDGNTVADDGCSPTCRIDTGVACNASLPGVVGAASCASGVCDTSGNAAPGVCENANACGNGAREANEGCDDGNTAAGDGCSALCLVETGGVCNASMPGLVGGSSCASGLCDTVGNLLPGRCEALGGCGNGQREAGEGCDDGNTASGDGCTASCVIENGRPCNTSMPGLTDGSSCASGLCDTVGQAAPGVCETANACGNGTREAGEGCDDGNVSSGDGCNAVCAIENGGVCNTATPGLTGASSCASGVCDTTGNAAPGVCEGAVTCGNGAREVGEGCDDGNTSAGDGCSATCAIENGSPCNTTTPGLTGNSSCVSGICDTTGNTVPGVCEAANSCGNGIRETGEGCDDGNLSAGDGCNASCLIETGRDCSGGAPGLAGSASCEGGVCNQLGFPFPGKCDGTMVCGNGVREANEGCDDGNMTGGDGCSGGCRVENGYPCNTRSPGVLQNASCASEICDSSQGSPGVCVGDEPVPDTDDDGVNDVDDLDDDNDGITDNMEGGPSTDTDGDGVPDARDLDSDDDGVLDAVEAGHKQSVLPTGTVDCPSFGSNGLCDALETGSETGRVSYRGDGSETTAAKDTDSDGVPDFRDIDTDNDGVYDSLEGKSLCLDETHDGLCDGNDDDGDGVRGLADPLPSTWGTGSRLPPPDTDRDGIADFRDLDSDNDGITDLVEGDSRCEDADENALCDGSDGDGDGLSDKADGDPSKRGGKDARVPPDTDGDGIDDYRDLESDGDGFLDRVEGRSPCTDENRDGVCDGSDEDGDGIVDTADGARSAFGSGPSTKAPVPDTDGDGAPDYRDLDSNGDGVPDIVDAGLARYDTNGDGKIDQPLDADGDGIANVADPSETFGGAMRGSQRLIGGGCNCKSDGSSIQDGFFPLALCALVLALRKVRRRTRVRAAAATIALLGAGKSTLGYAQSSSSLDVQLFKPGTNKYDILNVISTQTCGPACAYTGLWLHYGLSPLVLVDDRNNRLARIVSDNITADFVHSWGITKQLDIGIHLPVYLQSTGASDAINPRYVGQGWAIGAGDLRIVPRIRFWEWQFGGKGPPPASSEPTSEPSSLPQQQTAQPMALSIGLAVPIMIPTGRTDAFMGGGFIGAQPRLLLGYRWRALRIDANLGVNLRREERVSNVTAGNEFAWSLGAEYLFDITKKIRLAVVSSLHGLVGFVGGPAASNRSVELDVGARLEPTRQISVGIMVGRGLMAGYGSPDLRVGANVGFSFECLPVTDRDGDGFLDEVDRCPDDPEDRDQFEDGDGCPDPDNDNDKILDVVDRCPMQAETVNGYKDEDGCPETDKDGDGLVDEVDQCPNDPETKNGYKDEDGCPDGDRDGDGFYDDADQCPNDPEDKDDFEDTDGCPDPDNDRDNILDAVDKCPMMPETVNGFEDADGCPELDTDKDGFVDGEDKCPTEPETVNGVDDTDGCPDQGISKVKLEKDRIVILEKVFFATGKDVILDRSFSLLTEVAATLRAHPEVKRLRVEGHTDDQGNDESNMALSQRRAMSVRAFLVERGVDPARLVAQGYGETRPVAQNNSAKGREQNRRVEFVVLEGAE